MPTTGNWRAGVSATARFENVQNIQKGIEAAGEASKAKAQKAAFAAETEAYNDSHSLEAYTAVCLALSSTDTSQPSGSSTGTSSPSQPSSPGTTISPYRNCHLIASGLVSRVYRHSTPSGAIALKVITETHLTEPHNAAREARILQSLHHPNIITLHSTFRDQHSHLVLLFPYLPLTLAHILSTGTPLRKTQTLTIFTDLFAALTHLHASSILHRDIKPSNILLSSVSGPASLADFGTAWHPTLSLPSEPPDKKTLDVGTSRYRAPETLFGNRAYGPSVDIWAAGCVLAEALRAPPRGLFESRGAAEDGNQLGLILSIFKTLGTPTRESWPEAEGFPTPPFEWYAEFPARPWEEVLPEREDFREGMVGWGEFRGLVEGMLRYESGRRLEAKEVLAVLEGMLEMEGL